MKTYPVLLATMLVFTSLFARGAEAILANGLAANIANRARAGSGDDAAITGFAIRDAAAFVLIRAVGPGLAQFGVAGYATGTTFELIDAKGAVVIRGNSLSGLTASGSESVNSRYRPLGAFALPPSSADSFAYVCLNPGSYTVVARPTGSNPGIILTEVYFDTAGIGARVPPSFETAAGAADYASKLFASGRTDIVNVNGEDFLVLQVYGSGVPVIALGIYRFSAGRWRLASQWLPAKFDRSYTVKEHNGDLVVVGSTTGEEWVLLDL